MSGPTYDELRRLVDVEWASVRRALGLAPADAGADIETFLRAEVDQTIASLRDSCPCGYCRVSRDSSGHFDPSSPLRPEDDQDDTMGAETDPGLEMGEAEAWFREKLEPSS